MSHQISGFCPPVITTRQTLSSETSPSRAVETGHFYMLQSEEAEVCVSGPGLRTDPRGKTEAEP